MERLRRSLPEATSAAEETNGRVGVVGGAVEFPGQPTLTAMAALRAGADDAKPLVSEAIHGIVGSHSPNHLVGRYAGERFDETAADRAVELGEWADALVVGPGLVDADDAAVERTVSAVDAPTVVDALAIEPALGADLSETVFTPDESETDRIEEEYGSMEAFTSETGAVVVSTGEVDTISHDGGETTNETGTAALSVAGTGDTLAGIVAAFLAQGLDPVEAGELGAWTLGKAGELAATEVGNGVVATDVIEQIPRAIR